MPRRNLRSKTEDEDNFETEAFSFMNSETPGETAQEDDVENESEDDDEAPEAIGFDEGRQTVMDQIRSALQQVDSEKKKKKEIRKKIDDQYKEQKAKKLERIAKSKLPEDILEGLADSIPSKKARVDSTKKKKKKAKSETDVDAVDQEEPVTPGPVHMADVTSEDFIAFTDSDSGVKVAEVRAVERQTKTMAQAAADFRHSRLYGKHVHRESNKDRLATMEKRKQRFR